MDFASGLAVGLLVGLALALLIWFVNYSIKNDFDKREAKILENVKKYMDSKGGRK